MASYKSPPPALTHCELPAKIHILYALVFQLGIMLAIDFPGKKRIFMMNKTTSEIIRDIF